MKLSNFFVGVALSTSASLFFVACQKDVSLNALVPERESNFKVSGVVQDDPVLVSKIPMIVSSDFLKQSKNTSSNFQPTIQFSKGKPDNILPSVTITSPANGVTVSGSINVQASASDNVGVSLVSLSVDGTTVSSSSASPYTFPWNSATVANGAHTLTVTARDAAGNSKAVAIQISVNNVAVGDITKPTVNITSPTNGASVSSTVNVAVNAADNVGVSSVNLSVDGVQLSIDNSAPYSFSWNTTTVATGIHTLTATATDAAGNSASNSIQVTVNTTVIPPTTLPASFQLITPPIQNQGGEGTCVPFASAYSARSIEQFYKTNASSYSYATNIFSPEFLYNQIKTSDCGSGTGVVTALDFMVSSGVCTWQSMPYSSSNGCSLLPTTSQSSEAANYKITSYSTIPVSDITAIKTMVVNKHPVIITVGTDDSFWSAQPGFIWRSYSGPIGISHTLVICGYDDAKHAYKVMNSWGTAWGDAGFSWIDYDFLPQSSAYYSYVIND